MRKSHRYDELSDRLCAAGCGRRIKRRMLEQTNVRRCYRCHQAARGPSTQRARAVQAQDEQAALDRLRAWRG